MNLLTLNSGTTGYGDPLQLLQSEGRGTAREAVLSKKSILGDKGPTSGAWPCAGTTLGIIPCSAKFRITGAKHSLGSKWLFTGSQKHHLLSSDCLCPSFPGGASGGEPTCQFGRHRRPGFGPWLWRIPWGGHGNPLRCFHVEDPMEREAGCSPGGRRELEGTEAT